jgi:hypothetical protein
MATSATRSRCEEEGSGEEEVRLLMPNRKHNENEAVSQLRDWFPSSYRVVTKAEPATDNLHVRVFDAEGKIVAEAYPLTLPIDEQDLRTFASNLLEQANLEPLLSVGRGGFLGDRAR